MRHLQTLLDIMQRLRDPDEGCPWDQHQNFHTIAPFTIEEAYEVADAIERNDMNGLCSELGDLLFQVVYHAQMANEKAYFDFEQVVEGINKKLMERHSHGLPKQQTIDIESHKDHWEIIKQNERTKNPASHGEQQGILAGIGLNMPALSRAQKLQQRAAKVGFDWDEVEPILAKINEEIGEIQEVISNQEDKTRMAEEIGDLLFACVNLSRHLKVDAEAALRGSNRKFIARFQYIEDRLAEKKIPLDDVSLCVLEQLWQEAKHKHLT